jgi:MATE family multidrug resistance protein
VQHLQTTPKIRVQIMSATTIKDYEGDRFGELRAQLKSLATLAVPIVLARAGWMMMGVVDTIMVGRFSTTELAYQSLGNSFISIAFVPMMGMLLGTLVMSSNLFGQRRYSEIGAVWRRSLPMAFGLGVVIFAIALMAEPILLATGQSPVMAHEAGKIMLIYGYGMPLGGLLYITSQYFLEGIKRPMTAMVLMLVANFINVFLNWAMIFGNLGFDAMGAEGSAWATTIVRLFLTAGIIGYIWYMPGARLFGVRKKFTGTFKSWTEQRRLGYASGLSFGIEHLAFALMFIFAGLLGELDLAAITIVFNTFALFFMVSAGIGSAASVQVGIAYGQRNSRNIALAGWTGWGLMAVLLIVPAFMMALVPELFARIYTDDPALIALAVPIYVLGGLGLLLDTTQTVWSMALRGRHDKWFPTISHFASYIVVMTPLCWYMAFNMGRRGEGLFEGFIIASVLSVTLLTGRFIYLSTQDKMSATGPVGPAIE